MQPARDTSEGKAKVARNADKGMAAKRRESRRRLAEARSLLKQIDSAHEQEAPRAVVMPFNQEDYIELRAELETLPPFAARSSK